MQAIIATIPTTVTVGKLDLSSTDMSILPSGLANLKITELNLAGNKISAIGNGELKLTSPTLMKLDLSGNTNLATIGSDALPSKSTNQHSTRIDYPLYSLVNITSFLFIQFLLERPRTAAIQL